MKARIIICIVMMLLCVNNSSAQTRVGKTFKAEHHTAKKDTLITEYSYEVDGVKYPIIINKGSGACYVWRTSKNGRRYRMYMKKEIKNAIHKELAIRKE